MGGERQSWLGRSFLILKLSIVIVVIKVIRSLLFISLDPPELGNQLNLVCCLIMWTAVVDWWLRGWCCGRLHLFDQNMHAIGICHGAAAITTELELSVNVTDRVKVLFKYILLWRKITCKTLLITPRLRENTLTRIKHVYKVEFFGLQIQYSRNQQPQHWNYRTIWWPTQLDLL